VPFKYPSLRARIEAHIERVPWSGCWIWTGALNNRGYGTITFRIGGVPCKLLAHRVSYREYKKRDLPVRMRQQKRRLGLHTCNVACCVNPDHFKNGTQSANIRQQYREGRRGA